MVLLDVAILRHGVGVRAQAEGKATEVSLLWTEDLPQLEGPRLSSSLRYDSASGRALFSP